MHVGVNIPTFGEFADIEVIAELAVRAEATGWDGFFVWDHVIWPWSDELADPSVALTAVALSTRRIRFGPIVTPLPRRRPAKVARELATLDQLSGGRVILGAGAGGFRQEFDDLGESADPAARAAQLDEALAVLAGLWSGKRFNFTGDHYQVRDTRFRPTPASEPRIPVWIGGQWPRQGPLTRALRWDGYVPIKADGTAIRPADAHAIAERLRLAERPGFDLVVTTGAAGALAEYAAAGVTWWLETPKPWAVSLADMRSRIEAGPPPSTTDGGRLLV